MHMLINGFIHFISQVAISSLSSVATVVNGYKIERGIVHVSDSSRHIMVSRLIITYPRTLDCMTS